MRFKNVTIFGGLLLAFSLASCNSDTGIDTKDGIYYELLNNNTYEIKVDGTFKNEEFVVPTSFKKKSVTSIGDQAFKDQKKIKHVKLHDGITTIEKNAFASSGILDLDITSGVTYIGDFAFYDCDSLTEISIPSSVLNIGYGLFINCDNLKTVNLPDSFKKISWGMFDMCKSLDFTIPDSVNEIEGFAFRGNSMNEVLIPGSVKVLGRRAYANCNNLIKVKFEEGVEVLGDELFYDSNKLQEVFLPSSIKTVGENSLYGNQLVITFNGTKELFNELNVKLSSGSLVKCTDGDINI